MPAVSDLVHETASTTGTGNFTLVNVNGKRSFNTAFGTGGTDAFDYFISNRDAAEWERGTGHLSDATTLVRDTVIASSNSNNAVNFSAGTKDVTNDEPAGNQGYRGQRPGTATNDAASAGNIGEIIANGVDAASGVTLTNNVAANVTSISLTAGDWDVTSLSKFVLAASSCTNIISAHSTTSATLPGDTTVATMRAGNLAVAFTDSTTPALVGGAQRFSLSSTTTVYLVVRAGFSGTAPVAWGQIRARRMR